MAIALERKLYIGGRWTGGGDPIPVRNKYTGEVIATVPTAGAGEVDAAIAAAAGAAAVMREMPSHRRAAILAGTAQIITDRREEFARTIAAEAGKALKFARIEVDRGINTFAVAAEEAKRIHGETVPLDAATAGEGYFGFFVRRPVGVIAAITPFNFPLNLVAHKVAPALAAGNAIVLKPASWTPLTSLLLVEALTDAGLPAGAINLVTGPGSMVGEALVSDERVAMITFTGSAAVGRRITERAGIKKITLELGNTSPVIIAPDADLTTAAKRCAVGAYYNSGQVCLSVQRIFSDRRVYDPFTERFLNATERMVVGDPLDERVDVGPMIDEGEAVRIEGWVREATAAGARVAAGGRREGAVYWPTVLTGVQPDMKVVAQEAFAPVASVIPYQDFADALHMADATPYGLQASVFTKNLDHLFAAMRGLNFGGIIVNDTPTFRVDHMPYGGNRRSGIGREGVRYAVEEMTNIQMVAIRTTG
ncbi:MAG TPA: aldehyde dehydrogenase family protein [bacterium]|nr:aldehyde dehydrogenase family protein [bacterium]